MPSRLPSALSRGLRNSLAATLGLAVFVLANSLYLLFTRFAEWRGWFETELPILLQVMVLTHTLAGLVLVGLLSAFLIAHLPKVWKHYHDSSAVSGVGFVTLGLMLVVTGMFILTEAASRANAWAWWVHVTAALLAPAAYAAHRLVSRARPGKDRFNRFVVALCVTTLVLIAGHAYSAAGNTDAAAAGSPTTTRASASAEGFTPAAFVAPASRQFPSPVTLATDHPPLQAILGTYAADTAAIREEVQRDGFVRSVPIGAADCVRCHADAVRQWETSAHRFSSFNNPFYEAAVNVLLDPAVPGNDATREFSRIHSDVDAPPGPLRAQFCAGCHDPALLFAGEMLSGPDRGSAQAQAGLTCLACHAIDRINGRTGNGNYNFAHRPDPYLFPNAPEGSFGRYLHDAAIKARPGAHRDQMMTDAFRTPEYCAACHKVSLPPVINDYRWLRGQDEFDFWDDSGVSRNASRTFYLPDVRRICQDCHMPPEPAPLGDLAADNGLLRSHRFTAVNTALPFLRGDTATLRRIETFLQDEKLSVDIFALAAGPGRATTMDFRNSGANLTPGRTVTVDVVVRNRGVGHTFPGGTNDSNEGWLEFTLLDADGVVVAQSGHILPDGRLDAMAHVFNTVALDGNSNPVLRRNAQDIRAIAYANVIGPGTARIAHYEFPVPARFAGDSLTVRARLLWRKFNRPFTEFAFASNREAFRSFEAVPSLPITEIAVDKVVIRVGRNAPIDDDRVTSPADWTRFNDYGIGLLLEGDTRRARQAFRRVAELRPNEVDGELNLARAALSDGNLSEAYEHLQRAEEIEPGNPRVAWVWANVTQEDGRYDRAETAYRRVLEAFPGDRAAWRNLGRTLYLAGEYEAAIEALARVLAIDPEDRIAHYHTMLSYRALGRDDAADLAERAYEFYQIDESAQQITRRFLLENPGANVMSQRIRTHRVELEP